jgi:two-component system chemotaxis sensor kinase CheA
MQAFSRLARVGRTAKTTLALSLLMAATLLSACGGEDAQLLPGETSREITANLEKVKELSDEGDCVGAESAAQQVGEQVEALGEVDEKLKRALAEGAERLNEVTGECEEAGKEAETTSVPEEVEEEPEKKAGKEQGKEEKEREKEEKEREKEAESPAPEPHKPPSAEKPPPQANGEGKGPENGNGPPAEEDEEVGPSGGVGPGSAVGEGD